MSGSDGAAYSGPQSPEEVAEYDRELEEVKRKLFGQTDMDIGQYIDQRIEQRIDEDIEEHIEEHIDQGIIDRIFYAMD